MAKYYVDPNAAAGGDGTTAGLSGATCAYASLNAWEAARQSDLSETMEVVCASTGSSHLADATYCTIDGWTTYADKYLYIHTPSDDRHAGVWNATKYRMDCTSTTNPPLQNKEDYVRVDGLQFRSQPSSGNLYGITVNSTGNAASTDIRWTNLIIRETKATGMYLQTGLHYINNVIQYGATGSGIYCSGASAYIENSSACGNSTYGMRQNGGTVYIKNCYAGGNTTSDYTGSITFTTCMSSDATSRSGVTASIAYDTTNGAGHAGFTNLTGGSEDFTIQSASALVNAGTDLSADGGWKLGAVDIKGQSRSTWDIGAWEYVAPVTGIPTRAAYYARLRAV